MLKRTLLGSLVLAASVTGASAHPHVFVVVKSEVVFDTSGKLSAIRHHWTFDDMYSAFVTANMGKDGKDPTSEDLAPTAKTNVESLKEFGYFTFSKVDRKQLEFAEPRDYVMTYDPKDQTATLTFTLPLQAPVSATKPFAFQIYDPSYFVAFSFEKSDAVKLVDAPGGCSLSIIKPRALDERESKSLNESFFSGLSPGADFGIKLADRAIIACP